MSTEAVPGSVTHQVGASAQSILDQAWDLSPAVALRPERFGALAYHFGNRRLTFLRRPELVTVVRGLGTSADVRSALTDAAVPVSQWQAFTDALGRLASAGIIRRRNEGADDGS